MRTLVKLVLLLGISGCATDRDTYLTQHGCTISRESDGQYILCEDQSMFIPDQRHIKDIIDPCGDGPGHDEVLIVFDNEVIRWYKKLGLVSLNEFTRYTTTDVQRCEFEIQLGQVVEYER